jgi:hypothetical protein
MPRGTGDKRVPADLRIIMSMRVNESRSDDKAVGVNHTGCTAVKLANRGDSAARYRYIGHIGWGAGSINHRAVADEQVVGHKGVLRETF